MNTALEKLFKESQRHMDRDTKFMYIQLLWPTLMVFVLVLNFVFEVKDKQIMEFFGWLDVFGIDKDNFIVALLILFLICCSFIAYLILLYFSEHNKKVSVNCSELCYTVDGEELRSLISLAISQRVPEVRPGLENTLVAKHFQKLMPPTKSSQSVLEGKLAHIYRVVDTEAKLHLKSVCPEIKGLKIGVVQASPLDAFRSKEVR